MLNPSLYLPWQHERALSIYRFFDGKSSPRGTLRAHHAAAMVEQADAESSFFIDAWGDLYTAYGLWQMHDDRLARGCQFLGVAKPLCAGRLTAKNGLSLTQQCEIAWREFQTTESLAFALLLSTTNAHDAGAVACAKYERAGAKSQPEIRGQRALAWLNWLTQQS
ncbi:phage tail tip lysozyme [Methylocystis bryophila]|uniref:Phage tail lysozyme domain-containing protein n=1 Tax=Methylocystis bryophila TaxID=655015 RepID=A0A1W6MX65_9HYPH|nr:phage tail tip lysozyme [Methylocystis bryophila]ARN82155.1 hypothetical protein B1812_14890 [Methylocystis bryophila]BDV38287.1 hypothetical protein DSM21852_15400 [Methylocystis bryophila]